MTIKLSKNASKFLGSVTEREKIELEKKLKNCSSHSIEMELSLLRKWILKS
jgi:hypothetical protein